VASPARRLDPEPASDTMVVYEGLKIRLNPAPLGKRTLAFIIDASILTMVTYLFALLAMILLAGTAGFVGATKDLGKLQTAGSIALIGEIIALGLAFIAINHGYFVRGEFKSGATPGKRILGLKVVSLDGTRLTLWQCVLRETFRYVDFLLLLPGPISCLATDRRQRLGDLVAGTMVVYSKESEETQQFIYVAQNEYHVFVEALSPKPVPPQICDEYLGFAYPVFILGAQTLGTEQVARWEPVAREYLSFGAGTPAIDPESLLRFFAEVCVQTLNRH